MDQIAAIEQQLQSAKDDLSYLAALNQLAWQVRKSDILRAQKLAQKAQQLCEQHDDDGERYAGALLRSLRTQCYVHSVLGNYQEALSASGRGLDMPIAMQMPRTRVDLLNSRAWCVGNCGNHALAIKLLLEAMDLAQEIGNLKRVARTLNSLGAMYSLAQDHVRAVAALQESLEMDRQMGDLRSEAVTLNNLALVYADMDCYQEAYETALASLHIADACDYDIFREAILDTLGEICLKQEHYDKALMYLERAVAQAITYDGKADLLTARLHLGQVYRAQGRYADAMDQIQQSLALAEEIDSRHERYQCHETLSLIYQDSGDVASALEQFKLFHQIKEDVFSQEANERLNNLRTAYELETARKDAEISLLRNVALEQEIAERRKAEQEREQVISQLQAALAEVKTLSGLVPICASCKKIRSDEGYWEHVEEYISCHTNAQFTHGICPDCATRLYGEWAVDDKADRPG